MLTELLFFIMCDIFFFKKIFRDFTFSGWNFTAIHSRFRNHLIRKKLHRKRALSFATCLQRGRHLFTLTGVILSACV